MKVRIKNYQRLKDVSLTFKPGLTAIIGQNNQGKSSIVGSLDAAIFNRPGDSFVRQGEDSCSVGIQYNSHTVLWKKTLSSQSKTAYKVDSEVLTKVGRGQPEAVADALSIEEVEIMKTKEKLNFWRQMKAPLLMDKTPSQLYDFLALSAQDSTLTTVSKEMIADLKDIDAKLKKTEGGIDFVESKIKMNTEKLDKLKGTELLVNSILSLSGRVNKVDSLEKIVTTNIDLTKSILQKRDLISKYDNIGKVTQPLIDKIEPLISKEEKLKKETESCENLYNELRHKQLELNKLETQLTAYEALHLDDKIIKYQSLISLAQNLSTLAKEAQQIAVKIRNDREKVQNINRDIEELDAIETPIKQLQEKEDKLELLETKYKELKSLGLNIERTKKEIETIEESEKEIQTELDIFDVCPLCNNTLK